MKRRGWRLALAWLLGLGLAIASLAVPALGQSQSSYELSLAAPFNRLEHYPLEQNQEPPPDYRPTGDWVGRLILPATSELEAVQPLSAIADWVWLELFHAPEEAELPVGTRVRLEWADDPAWRNYVAAVSTDVRLATAAKFSQRLGNVIPTRLDGRDRVGPLQSLAGARPEDDAIVQLDEVVYAGRDGETPVLQIDREPLLVAERYAGLVKILAPTAADTWAAPAEQFRVQHYNPASGAFDGREEVVRIPQQPRDRQGRYLSTPHQLADSPAGTAGWYIYGARDRQGQFTVRALVPRAALQRSPGETYTGEIASRRYLHEQNWRQVEQRKGTLQRVLLDARDAAPATDLLWQEGDRALLLHLFGGIGGDRGEGATLGTVTGHFAYGSGTVVRDPFTGDLQWQVEYWQVYAQNPNGIIAGRTAWSEYLGNLQRGWLGSRPVSDVLVAFEPLSRDYQFGSTSLSPFKEIISQLQVMAARYRTGDGTGFAAVTPATSCVQDSNQALYIAIARLQTRLDSDPHLQAWLRDHPDDPEVARFRELGALRDDILTLLEPRGQVRPDWQQNAEYLAGVAGRTGFVTDSSLANALLSWRSMLPRRAHDEVARVLLDRGAALWVVRTNQVGGHDPTLLPIAPTTALGQYWLLPALVNRLALAAQPPTWRTVGIGVAVLAVYAAIALPLGSATQFLTWEPVRLPVWRWVASLAALLLSPAAIEELLFRVWLLPPPSTAFVWWRWTLWALLGLAVFVAYHPLQARTTYPRGRPTFDQPMFLILAALLGLACTVTFGLTGSWWAIAVLHWLVTSSWILLLGGRSRLNLFPLSLDKTAPKAAD